MTTVEKKYKHLDMVLHEIRNFLVHIISGDPAVEAELAYDSATHRMKYKDNAGVKTLAHTGELTSGAVTSVTGSSPVNSSGGTTPNITVDSSSTGTANYLIRRDANARAKVADAVADDDIAAWGQVKAWIAGMRDAKDSVRLATAAALPANTRTGNVLTASANGALTVDGVAANNGDRVLVKNEATGANDGIFDVTDKGSGSTPWILTRSADSDTSAEVTSGLYVNVTEGTANDNHTFLLTTNDPITLNTTSLTFADLGTTVIDVSGVLSKSGTTISLTFDASLVNSGGSLQVSKTKYPQLFSALIGGAGPATSYTVTNNGWSADMIQVIQIIEVSTGLDVTDGVSVARASNGDFTVDFDATSVAGTAYRYVLLGLPA